jgi:hypothetical protein
VPCCPPGASQMAVVGSPRAIRIMIRIDVQHDPGYLAPVGAFCIGIEHTHVGDGVLLVVEGERMAGGRQIRVGPSWGNGARAARDVRLPADHIRFAAAVQFCSG